ncbi:hypothetical protein Dimus_005298 [Dionaea muscipula]
MKNVVPRFGKRNTTSFMDLTYMDHLLTRRLVNLPRVMLRHMAYVISHLVMNSPYETGRSVVFEAYHVPLDDKQGEEPKSYDYFEETFLTMCQLKRDQGVWWLGLGANRRRDEDEAPAENVQNKEFFDAMDDVEDPVGVTALVPDVIAPTPVIPDVRFSFSIGEGKDSRRRRPFGPLWQYIGF